MKPLAIERPGVVVRLASSLTEWTERWMPGRFHLCTASDGGHGDRGLGRDASTFPRVIDSWGRGFWDLIPFTLQMSLIIITGQVVATSPPVSRFIHRVADPHSPRAAIALVTVFALASSWLNWGFSLAFSAGLSRKVARRVKGVD